MDFRLFKWLYYFVVVADCKSIGRASEKLHISQPPLSEHIKSLERNLGVQLFYRSKAGVELTSAGHDLLPKARECLAYIHAFDGELRTCVADNKARLKVGAITQAMTHLLPEIADNLAKDGIGLDIHEIDSGQAIELLGTGAIDVAFVRSQTDSTGIVAIPMLSDVLCAVLPPSHALYHERQILLSTLANENFVSFRRAVSPQSFDEMILACRQAGFSPNIVRETSSALAQIAMVGCSDVVALAPKSLAQLGVGRSAFVPVVSNKKLSNKKLSNENSSINMTTLVMLYREDSPFLTVIDGIAAMTKKV
ncbi:MAG: LysR family transcriptional regulator [Moraxella sp.]|nr:LysR family transcriptional regulator [Moraxella sp.]